MNIPETYDYLVRTRRDLWATLETVPDEVLSRPLLGGERFHCIKDLVVHTAAVEDGWIHFTVLRDQPVEDAFPALKAAGDGPVYAEFALSELLDYWRAVEKSTLAYLAALTTTIWSGLWKTRPPNISSWMVCCGTSCCTRCAIPPRSAPC